MITDEKDTLKHFVEIRQFLYEDSELLQELKDKKVDVYFDIGFTIDPPDYVARFLNIDKDLLNQMAEAEVGLVISSYLLSDDE